MKKNSLSLKQNLPALPEQNSLPVQNPQAPARLKIVRGPHKGAVYKIVSNKILIGRSTGSDIHLIKDDKCSRRQAVVVLQAKGWQVKDLSGRGSLKVNNIRKIQSELQDGDLIQCGLSVLQFEHKVPVSAPVTTRDSRPLAPAPVTARDNRPLAPAPIRDNNMLTLEPAGGALAEADSAPAGQPFPQPPPQPVRAGKSVVKKKSPLLKIVLGFLGVLVLFLMMSEDKKPEQEKDSLRTSDIIEEEIKNLEELKEQEKKKKEKHLEVNYQNAQSAYVKGIRDYRKGVYVRAIESFRVCKTLYPQHELCGAYLQKARIKKQQLIQAWMLAGKSARDKQRFETCMSSFKNVMLAVRNKRDLTYKEAEKNYDICKIQYAGRY